MASSSPLNLLHLLVLVSLIPFIPLVFSQARNAIGTLGVERLGSCGYGTFYPPSGVYIAGLSRAIYGEGATCGQCFLATCVDSPPCTGKRVIVRATNECLGFNSTSACMYPRSGIALQPEAWDVIATSRAPGVVPMRYIQVPCSDVTGGVQFVVQSGNQFYFAVLIQNVAGPGGLSAVSISANGGDFAPMTRSYGAVWEISRFDIRGSALSFKLTGSDGQLLMLRDVIPVDWKLNTVYSADLNYPTSRLRPDNTGASQNATEPNAALGPLATARATMGQGGSSDGACGFQNLTSAPDVFTAGFSPVLFADSAVCGACFRVWCTGSAKCKWGSTALVVATNLCAATNTTSVCTERSSGINLQPEAWDRIVISRSPGVVPVAYQRVACSPSAGGVQLKVHPGSVPGAYLAVLVQNVGGGGSLARVEIAAHGDAPARWGGGWIPMERSFGSVWQVQDTALPKDTPLSLRLWDTTGAPLLLPNALPAEWDTDALYNTSVNY